jgi:hypothetical protein
MGRPRELSDDGSERRISGVDAAVTAGRNPTKPISGCSTTTKRIDFWSVSS